MTLDLNPNVSQEDPATESPSADETRYIFRSDSTSASIILGDAAENLRQIPKNTINVAVTSPPYYWARDYGYDEQIGHEDSVDEYVAALMNVFDEVKRVLHPEGVFYLNIGDTYYSGNGQPKGQDPRSSSRNFMRQKMRAVDKSGWDIPKKSLIGIPWKVAFAMQERGWTLRSQIIWNRCNAFPEPTARDRPHRQYEPIFMFSKSRFYSYDRTALPENEEDVWNIPIQRKKNIQHNAPFPLELAKRCIVTGSPIGGNVLDPFLGSGTTMEAALELGRNSIGIEMSQEYFSNYSKKLSARGFALGSWAEELERLKNEPSGWANWKGNKANYRKPKSNT